MVKSGGHLEPDPRYRAARRHLRPAASPALHPLQPHPPRRPALYRCHLAEPLRRLPDRCRVLLLGRTGDLPRIAAVFLINHGVGGGPCPDRRPAPLRPRPARPARSTPAPASYTPFYLHLTRTDAEQEITSYSATLPPGLLGKIAGIPFCSDAAIDAAKRPHRAAGARRAESPAARRPADRPHRSGYGVGAVLAYAPGRPLPGRPLPRLAALDRSRSTPPWSAPSTSARHRPLGDPGRPQNAPRSRSTPPARTRSPTSSTASRCTCATSASTSTAPTSPSTRPAATRARSSRP